jgi:hypothetical protein
MSATVIDVHDELATAASRKAETFEPVTLVHIRAHGCRDLLVY